MAFAATTHWDVRTTGSDSNGGGFDNSSTGTDRTQQDTAFQTYTDLVIDATTNTKITSAAHPFGSTDVGNVINVTGGTGFTVQRVQIVSVAANVATCDKAVGTTSSTGGTGNLGGGLATVATAMSLTVAGNVLDVKSGTYTVTATQTLPGVQFTMRGYGTSHGDGGTKPQYQLSTSNNVDMFVSASGTSMWADNMEFDFTGSTNNARVMFRADNTAQLYLTGCKLDGNSLNGSGNGRVCCIEDNSAQWQTISCDNTVFSNWWQHNSGNDGLVIAVGGGNQIIVLRSCTFDTFWRGISSGQNTGTGSITVDSCIFNLPQDACLLDVHDPGVPRSPGIWIIRRNAFYGNSAGSSVAFKTFNLFTNTVTNSTINYLIFEQNIIYAMNRGVWLNSNSGSGAAQPPIVNRLNAYGNNGTDVTNFTKAANDITLTANPWTNVATPDFSLNSTAGGGAALRAAGFPGVLQRGGTGYADVGPLQHQDAGGGGTTIIIPNMNQTRVIVQEGE